MGVCWSTDLPGFRSSQLTDMLSKSVVVVNAIYMNNNKNVPASLGKNKMNSIEYCLHKVIYFPAIY